MCIENKIRSSASLFYVFLLLVASEGNALGQGSREQFQKSLLTFDLTVSNPSRARKLVAKVGVRSELRAGNFECVSGSDVLTPLADYRVRFHVGSEETIQDAEPMIKIEPRDIVRFTISLIPDATGACGYWASDVSAIVVFDNAKRIYTSRQLITSADVEAYRERRPKDEEIFAGVRHPDPIIRAQTVHQITKSTISRIGIERILRKKLDDPAIQVRTAAAEVAAEMSFLPLTEKIVSGLLSTNNDGEAAAYCEALGKLRNPSTIETLLSVLLKGKIDSVIPYAAAEALVMIGHPDVPIRVRALLATHIEWASKKIEDNDTDHYARLCYIAIQYGDLESVPLLASAVRKSQNKEVPNAILLELWYLTHHADTIASDPFALALRSVLEAANNHPESSIRETAAAILSKLRSNAELPGQTVVTPPAPSESAIAVTGAWKLELELEHEQERITYKNASIYLNQDKNKISGFMDIGFSYKHLYLNGEIRNNQIRLLVTTKYSTSDNIVLLLSGTAASTRMEGTASLSMQGRRANGKWVALR